MIYFTSDTHFSHRNILKYCNRPFTSIEEHDETLITNWNSVVTTKDTVYHLGDFGFGSSKKLYELSLQLNGTIYLIQGNHDRATVKSPCKDRFEWIKDLHKLTCQEKGNTYQFILCHYAMRSWNKSYWGVPHLYGHSHGTLPFYKNSLDVGVDCNNFYPVNIKQVLAKISELNDKTDNVKYIFGEMFGEHDDSD